MPAEFIWNRGRGCLSQGHCPIWTAMAIEPDCTFKCVSSAVILNHSAFCCSEWPQKSLSSNWTVCHLWKVWSSSAGADVATESTEVVAWPRLGHAEMEADLQALKISQVAQEQDWVQGSSGGGAWSLEVGPEQAWRWKIWGPWSRATQPTGGHFWL